MIPIDEALFRLILKLEINLFLCGMLLFVFFLFQVQIAKTCMVNKKLSLDDQQVFLKETNSLREEKICSLSE